MIRRSKKAFYAFLYLALAQTAAAPDTTRTIVPGSGTTGGGGGGGGGVWGLHASLVSPGWHCGGFPEVVVVNPPPIGMGMKPPGGGPPANKFPGLEPDA